MSFFVLFRVLTRLQWKPSCKTGSAKWVYDGVCADAEVFGAMLGLGGPPTFKTKKMTSDEFQNNVGQVHGSVRYVHCETYLSVTVYLNDNLQILEPLHYQ